MGEKSDQIEREICEKRNQLGENFSELEKKVKIAVDWRVQFDERPATLIALAFGGGIVLSALLPPRRSRHCSRDSYRAYSRCDNDNQRRLAQERLAQERVAQENVAQENVAYRNPAVKPERDVASTSAKSSIRDGKPSEARNNLEALAGALASLALASVAGVIDSVLPGFQHEFTRTRTAGPGYR
jgi:hypothetical protein